MHGAELLKKLAELESVNDQLQAELRDLDQLMKELGFTDGLQTLKKAAQEVLEEEREV
jgi:hypothetical protein